MEIYINSAKADIILESEKTLADVLAGLDQWLSGSNPDYCAACVAGDGFRLSGVIIDGKVIDAAAIDASLERDISTIKTLNILVSGISDLLYEALFFTIHVMSEFEKLDHGKKQHYCENWKASPAAALIGEQTPQLYKIIANAFIGNGFTPNEAASVIEEYMREIDNPSEELQRMETDVAEITSRLEELPLDIQTGKDRRASETIQYFSTVAEKVLRLYALMKAKYQAAANIDISEFSAILKEMIQAYETKDSIMVGDLAEYELAPRLRSLYNALNAVKTSQEGI